MNKSFAIAISTAILLAGCDGSLVFQYPKFVPNNHNQMKTFMDLEITPRQARIGDTLTFRVSGISSDSVSYAYINPADHGGGDPEDPDKKHGSPPVFRLGRLMPVNGVATLSFELRSQMGNDQFGDPFVLASSQSWTILVSQKDQYGGTSGASGGAADFTVL